MSRHGSCFRYQHPVRGLLRSAILDAMRELLHDRDWSKITLGDIATEAKVSRQTLYNEFGSRAGLAQAYAMRLTEDLVNHVQVAIDANIGDVHTALDEAFRHFIRDSATDPLVQSLVIGDAKLDLLRLVTLDAEPLLEHAAYLLSVYLQESWIGATQEQGDLMAQYLVRVALSFITTPPLPGSDAPREIADLVSPYANLFLAARNRN